jgi:hypothetical protein
MRRKKRVRIVEMPREDPEIEKYIIKKGIPVEIPQPHFVPLEQPVQAPVQVPKKWSVT